ncbi:methylated-DNA--[protein]-cysteine S-methyltransferase, partial [Clostridium polynesiense]|uniref:methylated-DNA--[protein]-cysteine S-methyltransferase n=1 Tax=Clostridium polynesiense TaxID=1325933 RepID=UPI00058B4A64
KVWRALEEIPYGIIKTYGEVAGIIAQPKASRAVGLANNRNPIPIFIPCHRVIGANGMLTGYLGGLEVKKYLLNLEKKYGNI